MKKNASNMKVSPGSIFNLKLNKTAVILVLVVAVTAFSIVSILDLKVNSKWSNALPLRDTLVIEYLKLTEDPLRGSVVYAMIEGSEKEKISDEFSYQVLNQPWARFVFDGRIRISDSSSSIYALEKYELLQHLEISKNININQLINLFKERLKVYVAVSNLSARITMPTENWNQFLLGLEQSLQNEDLTSTDELIKQMFFVKGNRIRSKDNSSLLILIGTVISEGTIAKIDAVSDSLKNISNRIQHKYPDADIKLTGYPITARDEMNSISVSGKKLTLWTFLLVTSVMILFYREWKFVAASMVTLSIAIIWTLTINQILFGELNTVTLIMGMVLIGLGIDFSIHWMNYKIVYHNEENKNNFNFKNYRRSTATPILAGALTTAAAFLALLLLNVKSINEFGLMSFLGIMLSAFLILLMMPLLITEVKYSTPYLILRDKIVQVVSLVLNHQRKMLILFSGLLVYSLCLLPNLQYEYNYAKLQTGDLPSYEFKKEINKKFGFASDVFLNRVNGVENAYHVKKQLETSEKIGYVLSISDFLPTREKIQKNKLLVNNLINSTQSIKINELNIEELETFKNDLEQIYNLLLFINSDSLTALQFSETILNLTRVINLLDSHQTGHLNRFNRMWIESFIHCANMIVQNNPSGMENQSKEMRYLFQTSKTNEFVQYIFPTNDTWEKSNIESLEPILNEASPKAVGLSRISWHISKTIVGEVFVISIVALIIILLTLKVTQKTFVFALITLIPLLSGVLFTLSTLSLFNIKVSIYNLISIPIILGTGIDYGLHVVHSYSADFNSGARGAIEKVGPAVFLTALTSIIGYGCLSFYTHPGISSLGIVTSIGLGWCLLSTILFLPLAINYLSKKNKRIGK